MQKGRIRLLFFVNILVCLYSQRQANAGVVGNSTPLLSSGDGVASVQPAKSDAVTETLRILAAGDREIVLDPNHREVILVVGMTGAGKSTITKFLAEDNSNLESYMAEDGHFLIRDPDNKISVGTLISKSIFPELILHRDKVTNVTTAFYDCPGFSDTRNASVEIANAFFIKRVADHATRLKILFVVNHSSLKSGQSRTAFKELLEQATSVIRNIGKFRRGISLIATKVDSGRSDHSLIQGIAGFLKVARKDLEQLGSFNERTQKDAQDLIDAFLVQDVDQDTDGTLFYSHIGLFRQPDELGLLSQIEVVQQIKPMLEQMVLGNGTEFVEKSLEDFKVSVSDKAKLLVMQTAEVINNKLADWTKAIMHRMEYQFTWEIQTVDGLPKKVELLPQFESQVKFLNNLTNLLKTKVPRKDFFNTILTTFSTRSSEVLENMKNDLTKLDFLEQLRDDSDPLPSRHAEWLQPFEATVRNLTQEIRYFKTRINSGITQMIDHIGQLLKQNLENKLKASGSLDQNMKDFRQYQPSISSLIINLPKSQVFGDIVTQLRDTINSVIGQNGSNLVDLEEFKGASQVNIFEDNNTINLADWIQPFQNLLKYIQDTEYALATQINEKMKQDLKNLQKINQQLSQFEEIHRTDSETVLAHYSEVSLIISFFMPNLKEAKSMGSFLSRLQEGLLKLNPQLLNDGDLKFRTEFYNTPGHDVQIFEPMSGKASPFKPMDWIAPVEAAQQFVQQRVIHFSKVVQEEKRAAEAKRLNEEIARKEAEAARIREEKRLADERHERERLAAEQRRKEQEEQARLDRLRHEEEIRKAAALAAEQQAKFLAEQKAAQERHQQEMARLAAQLAQRSKKSRWVRFRDGIFG